MKHNLRRGLLLAVIVLLPVAGCVSPATMPAATPPVGTAVPAASASPATAPATAVESLVYEQVDIPEAGVSLEVPAGWRRLEPAWSWAPGAADLPRLDVRWADLQPPVQAEAALLPQGAQTLASEPVTFPWGQGRRFFMEVYGPAPAGGGRAPVDSLQIHVIFTVQQAADRRAYDVSLAARDSEELSALQPVLDTVLASVHPLE